jgi:hypothetical protein
LVRGAGEGGPASIALVAASIALGLASVALVAASIALGLASVALGSGGLAARGARSDLAPIRI